MERSFGTIVLSLPERKILLVRHAKGHWGFPKGHKNMGEDNRAAALRELREEAGIEYVNTISDSPIATERYRFETNGKRTEKVVEYFLVMTCRTEITPDHKEVTTAKWFTMKEASRLHNFPSRRLVSKAQKYSEKDYQVIVSSSVPLSAGKKRHGKNRIQGSKHVYSRVAPLKIFNPMIDFRNVPNTIDTKILDEIVSLALRNTPGSSHFKIPKKLSDSSRSVIALIPALLHRYEVIEFHQPRGCQIGARKIDLYLEVIRAFGPRVERVGDTVRITKKRILPTKISLPFPSFTGTSTALLMACQVKGTSRIENASLEPEIGTLIESMIRLGISVKRAGRRTITVNGNNFRPTKVVVNIPEDRNVLVTRIMAAVATGKGFSYRSKTPLQLEPLVAVLNEMGVDVEEKKYSIAFSGKAIKRLKPVDIIADHYPAFCSDWHPLIAPILAKIPGTSTITDNIFEDRFGYIDELKKIIPSLSYRIEKRTLIVVGTRPNTDPKKKRECVLRSLDLRCGAMNVIASLAEDADTEVTNTDQIFRGYENIIDDMNAVAPGRVRYRFDI